jgi:hypothetical protein
LVYCCTRYKLNDVVKYGAGLWICTIQHTADAAFLTDSTAGRWTQFAEGTEFESTWNNSTLYQPGDIVVYGGNQYIAKTVHTAASAQKHLQHKQQDGICIQKDLNFNLHGQTQHHTR